MTNQVNQYEHNMAMQEAYQIHDSDEYFKARPQLECGDRRKVFYAGHIRGYQAATKASEQRIKELDSKIQQFIGLTDDQVTKILELQAKVNLLQEALTQLTALKFSTASYIQKLDAVDKIVNKALSLTKAQSLAEHDNEEK